jgi:Protein of unknown function (DUF3102)
MAKNKHPKTKLQGTGMPSPENIEGRRRETLRLYTAIHGEDVQTTIKRKQGQTATDGTDGTAAAADTDATLSKHAAAIRGLGCRIVTDAIDIGCRLSECKRLAGHGRWLPWLEREFGWTDDTALNFMRAHELAKSRNFRDLSLPVSALYLLAAPSTPDAARDEIIERAKAGEAMPVKKVKRVIEAAKGKGKTKRRASKAERENNTRLQDMERQWRAQWMAEGRSLADYEAGIGDDKSPVWEWRRKQGQAGIERERRAWLADHPGQTADDWEHITSCAATDAEAAEYHAWNKKQAAAEADAGGEPTEPEPVETEPAETETEPAGKRRHKRRDDPVFYLPSVIERFANEFRKHSREVVAAAVDQVVKLDAAEAAEAAAAGETFDDFTNIEMLTDQHAELMKFTALLGEELERVKSVPVANIAAKPSATKH